jgi:alcohol dehydrogenase
MAAVQQGVYVHPGTLEKGIQYQVGLRGPGPIQTLLAGADRCGIMAFDQVGAANDATLTLTALKSLRRGGRLVLTGAVTAALPITYADVMINDGEIIGDFMYRPTACLTLVSLVRSGLLDLSHVSLQTFAPEDLKNAMDAAAAMRGLDCTVVRI